MKQAHQFQAVERDVQCPGSKLRDGLGRPPTSWSLDSELRD